MKKQLIGGVEVNVTNHGQEGIAYGQIDLNCEQIDTLYINLCNKYKHVENHFSINGFMNNSGYFLCK